MSRKEKKNKKILRVKTGEFLLEVMKTGIKTTYKLGSAMDISSWSFEQLEYIMSNLRKVGYTKVEVVEIKEKDKKVKENETDNDNEEVSKNE